MPKKKSDNFIGGLAERANAVWNSLTGQTQSNVLPFGITSGIGAATSFSDAYYKAVIPNFLYKPPFGYPLNKDVPEVRRIGASPYVTMITNTIVNEMAALDWKIIIRDGVDIPDEIIEKTKAWFYNPNRNEESLNYIIRTLVRDLLEIDAGVIIKVRNMKDEFVEMYTRDGGTFTKNPDIYGILPIENAYYQYGWTTGARPIPFNRNEIVYMMLNPRTDSIYGRSPVETLLDVIQLLIYGVDSNLSYFNDNNIPKGVFQLIGANKDDIDSFGRIWQEQLKKKDAAGNWRKSFNHMPVVNVEGKFERIGFSNLELELIEQQKWFTKIVWACFNINPSELGFTEDSNKATESVQANTVIKRKLIKPIVELIEYHFSTELINDLPWIKGKYEDKILFEFDRYDLQEELGKRQLYWGDIEKGLRTVNEIREELNLEPKDGGDDLRGANINPYGFQDTSQLGEGNQEEDINQEEDLGEEEKSFPELKYKYIKRTGSPGNYVYWYKNPKTGKLESGEKPEEVTYTDVSLTDLKKKYEKVGKPFEEQNIEVEAYRVGILADLHGRGVFFADSKKSIEAYGSLHEDEKVKKYKLSLNKVLVAGHQGSITKLFFNKTYMDLQSHFGGGVEGGRKFDKKIRNEAKRRGYDAIIYTSPAPPADMEIMLTTKKGSRDENIQELDSEIEEKKALNTSSSLLLNEFEEIAKPTYLKKKIEEEIEQVEKQIKQLIKRELGNKTLEEIKAIDNSFIKRLLNLLSFDGLKEIVSGVVRANYNKGLEVVEKKVEMNFLPNERAINFIQDYTFDNVKGLGDELKQDLRQELQRGIMNGEGEKELSKRIEKVMKVGKNRADMIARTETNRAENLGSLEGYKQSGLKGEKEWIATLDKRTSKVCRHLNGKRVDLNSKFEFEGEKFDAPPAHVNCRSTIAFIPKEELKAHYIKREGTSGNYKYTYKKTIDKKTKEKIKEIEKEYSKKEKAKGQCHNAVAKIADILREKDIPFKTFSVAVKKKDALNHVLIKVGNVFYDPTGAQYGQNKKTFKENNIPNIYSIRKETMNSFYTHKRR